MATEHPVLTSRCRYANRRLFFGRARLYRDRVVLAGWTWTGRYTRTIALADVQRIRWFSESSGPNFVFYLRDGEAVRLRLQAGGLWKCQVEMGLGQRVRTNSDDLPGALPDASAA